MTSQKNQKTKTISAQKDELLSLREENGSLRKAIDELQQTVLDLKESEQTLRLSEEKFQLLFENAYDEVIHLDREGTVIDVNESVEKIFGFRREEVLGRNLAEFPVFNPGTKQEMLDMFKSILEADAGPFTEVEVRHKDGRPIVVQPSGSLLKKDGKVEGMLVFLKDVTERKR